MNLLRTFFSFLSQEFKIPIQEIEKEWSVIEEGYTSYYPYDKVVINLCDDIQDIQDIHNIHDPKLDPSATHVPTPIPVGNIEKKCLHEFVRSAKKGTLCGERVTSSGDFCNKHKKQHNESNENTNNDEKKYKNKKKDKNNDKKHEDIENKNGIKDIKDINENENKKDPEPKPDVKKPISIRLNYKINRYIHSDSGMTFFSKEEKVVFARYDKHQFRLVKLSADDILLCKMYGFRVDPNKWNNNQGSNEIEE